MPIIPWRPFGDLERWFEEFWPESWEESFGFLRVRTPRMNVYETENEVVAEIELPGVDPQNIDVQVKNGYLKVEAKGKQEKEEKGKGFYKREIGQSYFKRTVLLPAKVMEEKAEAEYENGILRVVMPKIKEEGKKVKIKVKTSKEKPSRS
mgnify:CR=1 FL=1